MVDLETDRPQRTGDEWLIDIANRLDADSELLETLTVRQFLANFGSARRGSVVVSRIRSQLEERGLRTEPDFEYEHIDALITLKLVSDDANPTDDEDESATDVVATTASQHDSTLRMGSFKAARDGVTNVAPDNPLSKATTLMQIKRYSQLPVMTSDYIVKGIISWESIANCLVLGKVCHTVSDCMVSEHEIPIETPLLSAVGVIAGHGYVLVRDEQNRISGIVTTSDLSDQFMQLAEPFLLIGEIEGYLRRLIQRGRFTQGELAQLSASDDGAEIQGIDDLTFGEYCRILENPKYWCRLKLKIDRITFVESLHQVRDVRNSIMHFNPGDTDGDTKTLRDVAHFLDHLAQIGA